MPAAAGEGTTLPCRLQPKPSRPAPPHLHPAGQGQEVEESGWKMVSGDVFRAPSSPLSLCVQIGSGVQIVASGFITLFFAALVSRGGGQPHAPRNGVQVYPSVADSMSMCKAVACQAHPLTHPPSLLPHPRPAPRASCPPPRAAPCSPPHWSCTCCSAWPPATPPSGCGAWSTAPTRAGSRWVAGAR